MPGLDRAGRIEPLHSLDDLEALLGRSADRPVWIFKHSLTCSVSSAARSEFQAFVDAAGEAEAVFGLVEIQHARPVSDAVAERCGVRHQSPQAILLRRRRPVWHASHWAITEATLAEAQVEVQTEVQAGAGDGG